MNHRENLLAAMRRQPCERVPFQFSMCDSLLDELEKRYGTRDVVEAFDMPVRYIALPAPKVMPDYRAFHKNVEELDFIDEWGVGHKRGSIAHFTHFYSPMADYDTPQQVLDYPYPDLLAQYRWDEFKVLVDEAHAEGRAVAYSAVQVFEYAWYLRGLDNLLADMLTDEDMAAACLDKMCEIQCEISKRAAQCGVDLIIYGDDVGTQRSLMMSKDTWKRWIMPTTAAVIAAAKSVNPDLLAFYHSDGVITDIIPELIEIGVDILNPIQPECMDPIEIKNTYGDRLSFWGTLGTQTTLPFGTPQEVYDRTRELIQIVGKGGGFCIAPTHLLEPEVPFENFEAYLKAVKDFGGYK